MYNVNIEIPCIFQIAQSDLKNIYIVTGERNEIQLLYIKHDDWMILSVFNIHKMNPLMSVVKRWFLNSRDMPSSRLLANCTTEVLSIFTTLNIF